MTFTTTELDAEPAPPELMQRIRERVQEIARASGLSEDQVQYELEIASASPKAMAAYLNQALAANDG